MFSSSLNRASKSKTPTAADFLSILTILSYSSISGLRVRLFCTTRLGIWSEQLSTCASTAKLSISNRTKSWKRSCTPKGEIIWWLLLQHMRCIWKKFCFDKDFLESNKKKSLQADCGNVLIIFELRVVNTKVILRSS